MRAMLKSKNLIPFPYAYESQNISGISFTVQKDGGILCVGAPTADRDFFIWNLQSNPLEIEKELTLSITSNKVLINSRVYLSDGSFRYRAGKTVNFAVGEKVDLIMLYVTTAMGEINEVVYPMLNEGSTALPYQPYFCEYQGIGRSKNLFPQHFYIGKTSTNNGVTAVGLENGMIRIKGTSTARPQITFFYRWDYYLPAGTYSAISPNIDTGCNIAYGFTFADGTTKNMYCTKSNKITLEQDTVKLSLFFYGFNDGVEHTYNYTCPIMLVEFDGYYSGEYQPYLQRYDMYMYDNLILYGMGNTDLTVDGVTFTTDKNLLWVTANGVRENSVLCRMFPFNRYGAQRLKINGRYFFKGCPSGGNSSSTHYMAIKYYKGENQNTSGTETKNDYGSGVEINTNGKDYYIYQIEIRILAINVDIDLVFKPELIRLIGD